MFVRLMSDLHLEMRHGHLDIPVITNEQDIVLVLAGDIGLEDRPYTYITFLQEMCSRHKAVVYIFGNHEFYHGSITNSHEKVKKAITPYPLNLHICNNEVVEIDNVAFICSTMWTNYNNADPVALWDAQQGINDFRLIRIGTKADPYKSKFTSQAAYMEHSKAKNFLFPAITEYKNKGLKTFVVTHFALSEQSIHEKFKSPPNNKYNPYYASNYDELILETKPDVCVHGHTHTSFDYKIGDTRIVCNPMGYPVYYDLNPEFNPNLLIEV